MISCFTLIVFLLISLLSKIKKWKIKYRNRGIYNFTSKNSNKIRPIIMETMEGIMVGGIMVL